MKKFVRISGIITTSMIAIHNMLQMVSPNSTIYRFWQKNLAPIAESDPFNIIIIVVCAVILGCTVYDIFDGRKKHCFTMGDRRFCAFFSKWYSQEGALSIFCDDLDGWIAPNGNRAIYEALMQKSQERKLHLFLGRESPVEMVDMLRGMGACVHHAPTDIITNYSFSCLSIMGNNSAVIIRNKQEDASQKIKFEEISNTYATALLNALINEQINQHE